MGNFEIKEMYSNNNTNRGATHVNSRKQITYYNPERGKNQSQNFLEMNDIVVPVMIKKEKKGDIKFAMQYTYIPAKNRVILDLPSIGLEYKKDEYSREDVEKSLEKLTNSFGLKPCRKESDDKDSKKIKFNEMSSLNDPVSQSFTDQTAKFVETGVEEKDSNKKLQWFSIKALKDLISGNYAMSIQTKYALLLLAEKHKEELKNIEQIKADVDEKLLHLKIKQGKDNITEHWPHKYRFGVEEQGQAPVKVKKLLESNKINIYEEDTVYGTSKDSIQCVICRKRNGRIQVGLSKQQRSPFIARKGIDEYLTEISAGMIDPKDAIGARTHEQVIKNAVRREVKEETGIKVKDKHLIKLSQDLLLSLGTEEMSKFYLAQLPDEYGMNNQKLDEQENISELEWFDLEELDIDKLNAPLPTKISLLMAKRYYENEREKEMEER